MSGVKIDIELREKIISVIKNCKLSDERCCQILQLQKSRYYRWQKPIEVKERRAWNRILENEKEQILGLRNKPGFELAPVSVLFHEGADKMGIGASYSTFYRIYRDANQILPYSIPRRSKNIKKPDIKVLMKKVRVIYAYDATPFRLVCGMLVWVIVILDMGSRKFVGFGIFIRSFKQKDVIETWRKTLAKLGMDPNCKINVLSDRGAQMKGEATKMYFRSETGAELHYARPYTPEDNAWVESFIKTFKYWPCIPDKFETVKEIDDYASRFQVEYNDHPHSSLYYVTPNEVDDGQLEKILEERKVRQKEAKERRRQFYYQQNVGNNEKMCLVA